MEQRLLREFRAIVWKHGQLESGERVAVFAYDLDHAAAQIAARFGKDVIVSLWNEDDAQAPR